MEEKRAFRNGVNISIYDWRDMMDFLKNFRIFRISLELNIEFEF